MLLLTCSIGVGEAAVPETGSVGSWVTTADGGLKLAEQPEVPLIAGAPPAGSATVTLRPEERHQAVRGFGASMTESSANLIAASPHRDAMMRSLFDPTEGIGLSSLRQPMGSSDFSPEFRSYDDVPPGGSDWRLEKFDLGKDREAVLPLLRQAREHNPDLGIMASPWSAPGWMKDNDSLRSGKLKPVAYQTYARYFVRFIQEYAKAGVPVNAVSPQNEPQNPDPGFPTMWMTAPAQAAFIANDLGPALAAVGMDDVRIYGFDHNWNATDYAEHLLADPGVRKYMDAVAFHCYGGNVAQQGEFARAHPDVPVHLTECTGTESEDRSFGDGLLWQAGTLVVDGTRNGAGSIHLWNLALDPENGPTRGRCTACTGLFTVDNEHGTVSRTASYYALGHASRFVRPGAVRVGSESGGAAADSVRSTAFRNPDGSLATVVVNRGAQRSLELVEGGRHARMTVPANSVATYVLR